MADESPDFGLDRTRFIDHRGHQILLFDFSNLQDSAVTLREIEKSKEFVAQQPEQSLYTLVNVENARYDSTVVQALKELAAHNKPYVIAGAVVGMSALHRIAYRMVVLFSGRKLAAFETLHEGKHWLLDQMRGELAKSA